MFEVQIRVVPACREGLGALDERRRLGLKDGAGPLRVNGENGSFSEATITISETFARDRPYRFQDKKKIRLEIESSLFNSGELEEDRTMLRVKEGLPEWRLVELWPVGAKTFIGPYGFTIRKDAE